MSSEKVTKLGVDAHVYGYPLVTMEMTRRVMTNADKADGLRGPMGQFINAREYPSAAFKDITAPNADTLYSVAWIDLAKERDILSLTNGDGRYELMPRLYWPQQTPPTIIDGTWQPPPVHKIQVIVRDVLPPLGDLS